MGKINSSEAFQFAQDRVIAYNDAHNGNELAKLKHFPSGDYIIVVVDEPAHRAHKTLHSVADTIFMEQQ